jgi:predicted transcriptional regulator
MVTKFQLEMMQSAKKGYCYDANPRTWDSQRKRGEMEQLVRNGLMEKLKNHSGDKHGFYALTSKGKQALEDAS